MLYQPVVRNQDDHSHGASQHSSIHVPRVVSMEDSVSQTASSQKQHSSWESPKADRNLGGSTTNSRTSQQKHFYPSTKNELFQHLIRLIYGSIRQPLPEIIRLHAQYPVYQTTKSYNLLLQHALRHRTFGLAALLSRQFRLSGLIPDSETYRLWISFYVKWVDPEAALELLRRTWDNHLDRVPLDVWTQLLGIPEQKRLSRGKHMISEDSSKAIGMTPPSTERRIFEIVRSNTSRMQIQAVNFNSLLRHLQMIVRCLVREEELLLAHKVILVTLRQLPRELSPKAEGLLLDLIHQPLAYAPISTKSHLELNDMLHQYLEVRHTLQYTSRTLFVLMRTLRRTKHAGWQSLKLLGQWRHRWGAAIEDSKVQRRVTMLSLLEGRLDIAQFMTNRFRADQRLDRLLDDPAAVPSSFPSHTLPLSDAYPKQGQEKRLWRTLILRKSLRQKADRECAGVVKVEALPAKLEKKLKRVLNQSK